MGFLQKLVAKEYHNLHSLIVALYILEVSSLIVMQQCKQAEIGQNNLAIVFILLSVFCFHNIYDCDLFTFCYSKILKGLTLLE